MVRTAANTPVCSVCKHIEARYNFHLKVAKKPGCGSNFRLPFLLQAHPHGRVVFSPKTTTKPCRKYRGITCSMYAPTAFGQIPGWKYIEDYHTAPYGQLRWCLSSRIICRQSYKFRLFFLVPCCTRCQKFRLLL